MLGENLKQLRKQHKISQAELAKQLFVSQQAVARWETNSSIPSLETLSKLATLFSVSIDYLLGRSDILKSDEKEPTQEEWDSLNDIQKEIIALMGNMSQESQAELLKQAQYQIWLELQNKD